MVEPEVCFTTMLREEDLAAGNNDPEYSQDESNVIAELVEVPVSSKDDTTLPDFLK